MNLAKLEKQFGEEFTDEQRIKFLMMVGVAALRGLGWNMDGLVPKYASPDIFDAPSFRRIALVLGHVTNLVKGGLQK